MKKDVSTRGALRVSTAVLDKLALTATREVQGVHDIENLVFGALIGGIAGGTIGFVEGGPLGATVGASLGSAAGAAVGSIVESYKQDFHAAATDNPALHVRISAEYGTNLQELAETVRHSVRENILQYAGVTVGPIEVEIVEVVIPFSQRKAALQK